MHGALNVNPVVCPICNKPCKFYPSDNVRFSCTNQVGGSKKKWFGVLLELGRKGGHFLKKHICLWIQFLSLFHIGLHFACDKLSGEKETNLTKANQN